jgi:hypothetical protein
MMTSRVFVLQRTTDCRPRRKESDSGDRAWIFVIIRSEPTRNGLKGVHVPPLSRYYLDNYSLLGMTVIVRAYLSQEHRIALFALPVGGCARTVAYSGVIIRGCEDGDAAV